MNKNIDNPNMNKSSLKSIVLYFGCSNSAIIISSSKTIQVLEMIKKEILSKVPNIKTCGEKSKYIITNNPIMEMYISENGMRIPPEYNICVISILNKVLGMNTVKASDKINTREKMKEIKKLLNSVFLKKTDMKIKFRINTDKVDTIIEILYIFKTVINKDLHSKKLNCFNLEWLYAFGVCLAFAVIAKSADSNKLIINSQTMINIFITP